MKRLTLTFLTIVIVSTVFMDCAQPNSHSRRPVTSIRVEPNKKSYQLGEQLNVTALTKLKEGTIDKIDISVDGLVVHTSKNLTNSFIYNSSNFGVGKHIIKVSAYKDDGTVGENYEDILVTSDVEPTRYSYEILASYPHNTNHFTQGLEFHNNILYEGTGQEGQSGIYSVNLKNGTSIKEYKLENQYFGEGITILNNKIFQLTYKHQIGFIYDLNTFELLGTWKFRSREGWGLTNDGHNLIMSDGTEYLSFINPETFATVKKIQVSDKHNIIKNINELEFVKGEIWANIWTTDTIVIIDPNSGKITGTINMSGLSGSVIKNQTEQIDVLNGIAWNPVTDKIYVTGKLWPKLFEIKLKKL